MMDLHVDVCEDLEKTQLLPAFTAEKQLDPAFVKESVAQIKIVELLRQTERQAREIEKLRLKLTELIPPRAPRLMHPIEERITAEEGLFQVCGALKDALSKVLNECLTRRLTLDCGDSALRDFEDCCDKLERILSAPGFSLAVSPPPGHNPLSFLLLEAGVPRWSQRTSASRSDSAVDPPSYIPI